MVWAHLPICFRCKARLTYILEDYKHRTPNISPSTSNTSDSHDTHHEYAATEITPHGHTLGAMHRKSQSLKNIRISSSLLGTAAFAARIPPIRADAGDDFSNNLFSDLAPIMALFGEQVAKQYMSHSTSWIEDLIFAIAPLGIITAITGAIRVGGPSYLKAIIGRAREGKGGVELELMSSTSTDVCELWNGNGISRVQGLAYPGPAPIIEVYHMEGHKENDSSNVWESHPSKIYDFKRGREAGVLREAEVLQPDKASRKPESATTNSVEGEYSPPNLGFNIGPHRVSLLELRIVAVVGILLQSAVIVFAGISFSSPWNKDFTKDKQQVALYAFLR
jgi:hypothetical protein